MVLKINRKQTNNLVYPLLIMGVLLIFASSCKKEDNNNTNPPNTFIDHRDGNVYKTVTIGSQTWMAENLRYLPSVVGPGTGSYETPCYYVYGYNGTNVTASKATDNYSAYGVLYNWTAAMNACPVGWHLPSDEEWEQLIIYIGNPGGGKLKETGTTHWSSPNTGATNETGFTALPSGYRNYYEAFGDIGQYGGWWSATELGPGFAWGRRVYYEDGDVSRNYYVKEAGFSVRCVRD